jgi:hypothetical protein
MKIESNFVAALPHKGFVLGDPKLAPNNNIFQSKQMAAYVYISVEGILDFFLSS